MSALVRPDLAPAPAPPRPRIGWIDGARGFSIVAMIVSHVGFFFDLTPGWFHLYVMRPFAPMFLLLLGMNWRPGFRPRHRRFIVAAVASAYLAVLAGFAFPNILTLMGATLLLMPWAVRWPHATLALCFTQVFLWPMPAWWTGYAPGFVLGLAVIGATIPADGFVRGLGELGSRLGLEVVGRRPLTFYLGHLGLLAAVATFGPS